jgi:hypothetical protein
MISQPDATPRKDGDMKLQVWTGGEEIRMHVWVKRGWTECEPWTFRELWTLECQRVGDSAIESGDDDLLREVESLYMTALLAWPSIEADIPSWIMRLVAVMERGGLSPLTQMSM